MGLPAGGPCEKADMAWRQAVVNGKDPVLESALAFINNWPGVIEGNPCAVSGVEYVKAIVDDLLTANLKAARSFFVEYQKGKSGVPADSACTAATLAYAQKIQKNPSGPNAAGMIAYVTEAIKNGERKLDPVCGVATLAYWDAYIEKKSEAAANEAAAVAYLEALDKNPDFDRSSACGKAADAYIREFQA